MRFMMMIIELRDSTFSSIIIALDKNKGIIPFLRIKEERGSDLRVSTFSSMAFDIYLFNIMIIREWNDKNGRIMSILLSEIVL